MRIGSFGYLIKEGSKSVWTNRLMSFAAVGVLAACMLLIGAAVLLSVNMNNAVGYVEKQNEMVVILTDDLTEDELRAYDKELRGLENISDAEFISKEQALQQEKENWGDAADLLEMYENDNPLPNMYRVRVKDLSVQGATVEQLAGLYGTGEVRASTDIAETLVGVRKVVVTMGFGIIVLLVAVTLIIIANTIKITVFNRRKEISIMKYVGATDLFIKLPFVIEGLLLGLLSATFAYFILWGSYDYLVDWLSQSTATMLQSVSAIALPFEEIGLLLYGGFACGGVLLGVMGSMIFVRNYLKV